MPPPASSVAIRRYGQGSLIAPLHSVKIGKQLVDAAHVQVRAAPGGRRSYASGPPRPVPDRDGERPAAVRHRHLELRVVADHRQLRMAGTRAGPPRRAARRATACR